MKASQTKSTKLVLHNPPLEDPKFRFLIQDIRANKRFFFNGEWHELHQDFQLELVQPDLSTYPEIIAPKGLPGKNELLTKQLCPCLLINTKLQSITRLNLCPDFLLPIPVLN